VSFIAKSEHQQQQQHQQRASDKVSTTGSNKTSISQPVQDTAVLVS